MNETQMRALLNQRVKVVNGAAFKPGKFALSNMVILNPDGSVKVASKSKKSRTRWFDVAGCSVERAPEQA